MGFGSISVRPDIPTNRALISFTVTSIKAKPTITTPNISTATRPRKDSPESTSTAANITSPPKR